MNRRTVPVATALAAAGALLLSACGSDAQPDDKIKGADQKETAGSASPTADATAPAKVADFDLPKDVKVEIESDATGDKAKDRILEEQAEGLMARQRIFVDLDPESPFLTRYYADEALAFYTSEIKKAKAEGRSITGTYRYYDRKIVDSNDDRAVVTYCEDRSKAYAKDIKTGKARKTQPSPNDFISNTAVLRKTPSHTWLVQSLRGEEGAAKCR